MAENQKPIEVGTYVIATVRLLPEGKPSGVIDGVILEQKGPSGYFILDKSETERWAKAGNLFVKSSDGKSVQVTVVDERYVRTAADKTKVDNLKSLAIFDRIKKAWVSGTTGQPVNGPTLPR